MTGPFVYRSRVNLWTQLRITTGAPYLFAGIYAVMVPGLKMGDIVRLDAQFEVTNPYSYNVQVDRYCAIGVPAGYDPGLQLTPITGSNVSPAEHHMRDTCYAVVDDALLTALGTAWAGDTTFSLVLEAASTSAGGSDTLSVADQYGEIVATVWRS